MRDCLLWGLVFTFVLVGCGESSTSTRLGDWTMKTGEGSLTKTLEVSETKAFYFGAIVDMDVTADGRMVVADRKAKNLKILGPDGSLIDTLGGPGEGPGEFQSLMTVQVARGDSVYAYDYRQARMTVFAPSEPYSVARNVTISGDHGFAIYLMLVDDTFVGAFSTGIGSPDEGVHSASPRMWRLVRSTGTPADTLLQARRGKMAITAIGDGFRLWMVPFTRTTKVRDGPDARLYYGWNDSLHIKARTVSGERETIANIPAPSVPVSEAARDSAVAAVDENMRSLVASAIPDTKPAFTDFIVGHDGRVWVQRPANGVDAEKVSWWILDPAEKTISKVRLPREMDVEVVRKGQVYGSTTTEMGAPAVVRYRIAEES